MRSVEDGETDDERAGACRGRRGGEKRRWRSHTQPAGARPCFPTPHHDSPPCALVRSNPPRHRPRPPPRLCRPSRTSISSSPSLSLISCRVSSSPSSPWLMRNTWTMLLIASQPSRPSLPPSANPKNNTSSLSTL